MKLKVIIFSLVFFFPLGIKVLSHPHIFIDAELVFVFDADGLSGIRERWAFDEMFSQDLLYDFDVDGDSVLNKEEVAELRDIFYENTKEYGYFNIIHIDGKKFTVQYLTDFNVIIEDYRLVYEFFVPCHVSAGSDYYKTVEITLFDETIYTDIVIVNYETCFEGGNELFFVDISYEVVEEVITPLGSVVPDSVTVSFKGKQ